MNETGMKVRTRFAPSPTGFQHVGGMRTAMYAWLFARKHGGQVLLRVEDTDQERKVPGALRFLIEELAWLGIKFDEGPSDAELKEFGEEIPGGAGMKGGHGPYIQTQKLPRYREVAEKLIASGHAYRCDCTQEMLEKERLEQMARKEPPGYTGYCRHRNVPATAKHVVRVKIPERQKIVLNDPIHGTVTWEDISLRDPVIMKSDGISLYHLAVVVDDHDMEISHVMRGIEWMATAPLHLYLYDCLGWKAPVFAHLPVVLGPDGKKLSKRHGAMTTKELREQGFLPEAVLNYVTLVGWAPGQGNNQEIFTRDELIKAFSLEGINSANGVFDPKKMEWMNGMYIRALSKEEFAKRGLPFLERGGFPVDLSLWEKIAPHVQERVKNLAEIPAMVDFLFKSKIERDLEAMYGKGVDKPMAQRILERAAVIMSELPSFDHATLEAAFKAMAEEFGLKAGPAYGVVRIAVTGKRVTPPLFESISVMGKDVAVARVKETIGLLAA